MVTRVSGVFSPASKPSCSQSLRVHSNLHGTVQYQIYKLSSAQFPHLARRRGIRGALRVGNGRLKGRETG
jgi:hypothetical protein